ncbi:MAG: hypothetical protein HY744_06150 [Deltaproteobacteria bacterium]|nr:hypothetical protein [Deltaproteobacteria bacterium]
MKRQQLAPAIAERCETPLSIEAYARRLAVPPNDEDVERTRELVRWFCRRYPTAKERFAYIRRKYAEWTRNPPVPIEG